MQNKVGGATLGQSDQHSLGLLQDTGQALHQWVQPLS